MSTEKIYFTDEHCSNLPTVRIKKAVLKDFKNVGYGEILFNCGRSFIPYDTEADILGIYGQNGSGKTSFIEALSILKSLLSGHAVNSDYAECVSKEKDHSELCFTFDLQYPNGVIREASYSFCMSTRLATEDELSEKYKDSPKDCFIPEAEYRVVIYNELFSLLWEDASKKQVIIDTSSEISAFTPESKRKSIAGVGQKTLFQLKANKQLSKNTSKSFIFMNDTLDIFEKNNHKSVFFQVLVELRLFARHFLYVVDTKSSGLIRLNFALPIITPNGQLVIDLRKPMAFSTELLSFLREDIDRISNVLVQLVPGLSISLKKISDTIGKDGEPKENTMLVSYRNGKELPLRDESDGVRKLISVLSLIVAAFNEKSVTVAIDEFDAGIFEYLLGEILQSLEQSGKGQFIFTSHNLRPLEVIDKKYLYFTTTNPQNRYIRLKKIASTNNLRDTYFREIIMCEQQEEIYNRTKRFRIIAALKQAGGFSQWEKDQNGE